MKSTNITGIGTYVPFKIKKNSDFDYLSAGIGERWLESAGIKERRVAEPEETNIDLAYKASIRAIEHAKISTNDIDIIFMTSSTLDKDRIVPSGVIKLQNKLGIKNCKSYFTIDTCCGGLMLLELAKNAILAGEAKNVLVVASETPSKSFNPDNEITFKVGMSMGDGAGAIILSGNTDYENGRIGSYVVSDPRFDGGLVMKVNEVNIDNKKNTGIYFSVGNTPPSMDGRFLNPNNAMEEIKKYTSMTVPDSIKKLFNKCNLSDKDIDFYITHQPNREFIKMWRKMANIPEDKTLDTLSQYGNLSSVSIVVNLDTAYQLRKIKKGDNVLLASIGEGVNMGATVWKWQLNYDEKHDYLINEIKPNYQEKLRTVENYSMSELWDKFIIPGTKDSYTHGELFSEFIPTMAFFENVAIEDAFEYLSKTETMSEWTMSMRNLRKLKDDIYQGDEAATPTGSVFVRTIADKKSMTIEWYAGHSSADDMWIYYRGMLVDGMKAFGKPGSALLWSNFFHENAKKDKMLKMGFKMMFSAHKIEINNLKIILEEKYGKNN